MDNDRLKHSISVARKMKDIGKEYGNDVGYEKRLEDIKTRYGENSKPYICSSKIINSLKKDSELYEKSRNKKSYAKRLNINTKSKQ